MFTGTVSSGTGSSYQVLLNNGQTVTVTILQIDATQTIPAGTKLLVAKVGSSYYAQATVWM